MDATNSTYIYGQNVQNKRSARRAKCSGKHGVTWYNMVYINIEEINLILVMVQHGV